MGKFIGIYGGSFDPIHIGHLNLATEMMETHALDEVWFCPAWCNPHKYENSSIISLHRLEMIRLAIQEESRFHLFTREIERQEKSYTIDTLRELANRQKSQMEPDSYALILGEDAARSFYNWHMPEEIIKIAKLLVGRREPSHSGKPFLGGKDVVESILNGMTSTRIIEVSSTDIRKRLLNKKYCYHLVPGKVMDYIISYHLYS